MEILIGVVLGLVLSMLLFGLGMAVGSVLRKLGYGYPPYDEED